VRRNAVTIPNGLDVERFARALPSRAQARLELGLEDSTLAAVCVGTVCERKGQVDLVKALAAIPPALVPRLPVFVIGDRPGPCSELMHGTAARLPQRLRSQIVVLPEMADVGGYYAAADMFVCTSRIESYPRVILEAMAAGLPIVTTPVYGIGEQIHDGVN